MSTAPIITLGCRRYDRTHALLSGAAAPRGFALEAKEWTDVAGMFTAMFRGECDASEMSLAELIYYRSRGATDLIGIPVFPSRVFRHAFLFCNTGAGITGPESLQGKRIGFPRLVQTACIWIRGMLLEDYGLSPRTTRWFVAGKHHWGEHGAADEAESIETRDGSVFQSLARAGDEYETIDQALLDGRIDALGTARVPPFFRARDPRAARVFPEYVETEAAYYRRTRIFPIMHVLVARKATVDRYPELPQALFDAFVRAKRLGREWLLMDPSIDIAWKNAYLEREEAIFGGNPWVHGLARNAHVLEKFLGYCRDLGIGSPDLSPRDLFHPSTWTLEEPA